MAEIVIVGVCGIDAIAQTIGDYPLPGGLASFDKLTLTTGGNALNCSMALGLMGIQCEMIVKVGDDNLAGFIVNEAVRRNVGTAGLIHGTAIHTPYTFVCVLPGGQRSFLHTPGANATLRYEEIDQRIISKARFCLVTGSMIMRSFDGDPTARLFKDIRAVGGTTLLDTVYVDGASRERWQEVVYPCLPHLDYFVPSEAEARAITGLLEPKEIARSFLAHGCRNVVIKMAERGVFCCDSDLTEVYVPAYQVPHVVDTTGAGDAWCAGFLAGIRDGLDLADSALLGNAVAAHCVQVPGASNGIVSIEAIKAFQYRTVKR